MNDCPCPAIEISKFIDGILGIFLPELTDFDSEDHWFRQHLFTWVQLLIFEMQIPLNIEEYVLRQITCFFFKDLANYTNQDLILS